MKTFVDIYSTLSQAAMAQSEETKQARLASPATQVQLVKVVKAFKELTEHVENQDKRLLSMKNEIFKLGQTVSGCVSEETVQKQLGGIQSQIIELRENGAVASEENLGSASIDHALKTYGEQITELAKQMDYLEGFEKEVVQLSSRLDSVNEDVTDLKKEEHGSKGNLVAQNNFQAIKQIGEILQLVMMRLDRLETNENA